MDCEHVPSGREPISNRGCYCRNESGNLILSSQLSAYISFFD